MKKEKGQALVEFALILPLLILLLFGIIDFGRVFHAVLTVDHAGREAARAVSVGKTDDQAISLAYNNMTSIGTKDEILVTISPTEPHTSGSDATITITYPIHFLTPVIGDLAGPFDIKDTTTMRVE